MHEIRSPHSVTAGKSKLALPGISSDIILLLLLLLFGLWVMADDRFEPCVVPSIYFQQLFLLLAAAAAAAVGAALWTLPDRNNNEITNQCNVQ